MICYQCKSVLGAGKHCLHCGADVTVYKKIVKLSNNYYNAGLEKAMVRDLSGAAACLRKSIEYDKKNVNARNLLGLVYYEMGEVLDALSQWIVSHDYQPYENVASEYIEEVRNDRKRFEDSGAAVKGYNQALEQIKNDGEDLAIIQLRKVIEYNPNYIKAYQLLALLLIKEGETNKAGRIIKKGLEIDKSNTSLIRYANEIKGKLSRPKAKQQNILEKAEAAARQEVVIPRLHRSAKLNDMIIGAVIAVAVCLVVYLFLVKPSVDSSVTNTLNQNEISYFEKSEDLEASIQNLNAELDVYKEKADTLDKYTAKNGIITNYENLLAAVSCYYNKDYENLSKKFSAVDPKAVKSETFTKVYNSIKKYIGSDSMLSGMMQVAKKNFSAGKYNACMDICKNVLSINGKFGSALYFMGLSYEAKGDDASAAPYFRKIVKECPGSDYYELAKRRVG